MAAKFLEKLDLWEKGVLKQRPGQWVKIHVGDANTGAGTRDSKVGLRAGWVPGKLWPQI